jgi:wobble nucleotide-excising tRNase
MISKFIKITGTGKFLNYRQNTPPSGHRTTDFERINLIYGENGSGKTTLSIILSSLKGNNAILAKKRSFNRTVAQDIDVLTDLPANRTCSFTNGAWNNHYPNIEIFDIHFINENIYTGMEIQSQHRKNLLEIIFGQVGIQLKTDIQQIKDDIKDGNKTIKDLTEKIEGTIDKSFTAIIYSSIPTDTAIDAKILAKEAEITTAKSYREIQSKSTLAPIPSIDMSFDFDAVSDLISQSVDTISSEYLEKFTAHKNYLDMSGNAEEWLEKGYHSIKEENCPFCKQALDSTVDIIEAYKQYFNEEYNNLLNSLAEVVNYISKYNLEAQILQTEGRIAEDNALIDWWKNHSPNPPTVTSIINQKDSLLEVFADLKALLDLKSKNPVLAADATAIIEFKQLLDAFNSRINGYNSLISIYNSALSILKSSPSPQLGTLEVELKKLKAVKKRGEAGISTDCTNLIATDIQVKRLNQDKTTKQQQLDAYTSTLFSTYSGKINQYLRSFASYLEIRNLDSGYIGSSTQPMIKYVLHVDGNEIKLEDNATLPSFRYCLSEGDKSALALAFFLAKLETDTQIQDKIIVFDDPVSSFDLNRKSTTIHNLLNFGLKAKQLFVLTHNLIFAGEFWKAANQLSVLSQCSKIVFLGNSSCIVEYDIEVETISSILKDSLKISSYLENGCVTDQERRDVARCLRPALESYFHLKFFNLVEQNDWLGNFIERIRNSVPGDLIHRLQSQLQEFSDINDYSKKYHHRFNNNNENEPVNDSELRGYCTRSLELIQLI